MTMAAAWRRGRGKSRDWSLARQYPFGRDRRGPVHLLLASGPSSSRPIPDDLFEEGSEGSFAQGPEPEVVGRLGTPTTAGRRDSQIPDELLLVVQEAKRYRICAGPDSPLMPAWCLAKCKNYPEPTAERTFPHCS